MKNNEQVKKDEQKDELLRIILNKLSKNYETKTAIIKQVSNYDNVKLIEFSGFDFTVGIQRNGNHGHFLMMEHTIKEIEVDLFLSKREIKPKIIFTIKFDRDGYTTSFSSGGTKPVYLNMDMSNEFFKVFMKLQKKLHKL